jgi:hypothetical protein
VNRQDDDGVAVRHLAEDLGSDRAWFDGGACGALG